MRQENGACRSVVKDVARGPAQKHLAQAAMGIGAHDQQAGFMLCPRREQRIAHRAQFRCNHLRGRTDAMTAQIGKHLRLRGLAIAGVPINAYDPH